MRIQWLHGDRLQAHGYLQLLERLELVAIQIIWLVTIGHGNLG